jgi:hypothetical protein
MPVIPVNRVVVKKKIIGKMECQGGGGHKGLLTKKQNKTISLQHSQRHRCLCFPVSCHAEAVHHEGARIHPGLLHFIQAAFKFISFIGLDPILRS